MKSIGTKQINGTHYPVMAWLPDAWALIAVLGGPALGYDDGATWWLASIDGDSEAAPEHVVQAAVKAYRELTWPMVCDQWIDSEQGTT